MGFKIRYWNVFETTLKYRRYTIEELQNEKIGTVLRVEFRQGSTLYHYKVKLLDKRDRFIVETIDKTPTLKLDINYHSIDEIYYLYYLKPKLSKYEFMSWTF